MKCMAARAACALLFAFVLLAGPDLRVQAGEAVVPIEDFFRHPAMTGAQLSPSGKLLGVVLAHAKGRMALGVIDLDNSEKSRVVAVFDGADVNRFRWVNEHRLVFDVIDLTTGGGDQDGAGLFAVNADGSDFRRLVKRRADAAVSEGGTHIVSRELSWNHSLLATLRDGSDDVIVKRYNFDEKRELESVTLLRLNTVTRQSQSVSLGAPPGARAWVVDGKGEPRVVTTVNDGVARIHWRDTATGTWTLLAEGPMVDVPIQPLAVDAGGTLYVTAARNDAARTSALYRYDVAGRRVDGDPLIALAGFDFDGPLLFDDDRRKVVGARYLSDAEGTLWLDPAWKRLQERVDKLLPATVNRLSGDAPRVLVRSASDRQSPIYWLYDSKDDRLVRIGAERPWIDPKAMAQRNFVRIKARDGLEVPAYVTQPRGKGPWPAVVLVHGGPWVRGGRWEWQAEPQFLASRGYLVVEPEFRGSTGFGAKHFRAGFKQWGLAMQDDIADAASWAVQQGLADRARMCIAGASYGGYATLMGLARQPELYRCGIEWVGVTDLDLMYDITWSDTSEMSKRYGMPALIGDPVKDAAQLAATSPLKQADRIRQPVLMAYGGSDRRVPIEHGTRFRDAVSRQNHDIEWVEYPDEGHGFLLVKNQVDFWGRVEKFLARHLRQGEPAKAPGS